MSGGSLKAKTTLITGGARGIGAACVRHFVAEGARVTFLDLRKRSDIAARLVKELKG